MTNKRNTTDTHATNEGWSNDHDWSLGTCVGEYAYIGIQHTNGATQHVLVLFEDASLEQVTIKHRGKSFNLELAGFDFAHRMPLVDIRTLSNSQINELCYMPY